MAAQFGRRLRKGAVTTTVAAVAVAALSASQAPGAVVGLDGGGTPAGAAPPAGTDPGSSATGDSPYYTDLPPLESPNPAPTTSDPVAQGATEAAIPATVLDAYKKAEAELRASKPECHLPWELLAAIGKVESGHASGGRVDAEGTTLTPIIGPQLDGNGFALIRDTDGGAYDGNSAYDNAVGPMQFIPSTWAWAGRDGNADGAKDPNNVYDAALAAGHYLCRFGWDLSVRADLDRAVLSYNNSRDYLRTVVSWLEYYRKGTHEIPDGSGALPEKRSDEGSVAKPPGDTDTSEGAPAGDTVALPAEKPADEDSDTTEADSLDTDEGTRGVDTPPAVDDEAGADVDPSDGADTSDGDGPVGDDDIASGGSSRPAPTPPAPPAADRTPTDTVARLWQVGRSPLTAVTGEEFAERAGVRAETAEGEAVGKVRVRFVVVGDTDAAFAGGERVATVLTDGSGLALAPPLEAGERTGAFVVRAGMVGRDVPPVVYRAAVSARAADTLTRVDETEPACEPGGEFAGPLEVRVTHEGAAASGVTVTAVVVTSETEPSERGDGPYFEDPDGVAVRTLEGETDAAGALVLPTLYADDIAGTFTLRLTTPGGGTLDIPLTVLPDDPADPTATPDPTPTAGPSEPSPPRPSAGASAPASPVTRG
ncbi:lytic transglycosylase domain-containing protein [Streptomyces sp. WMMC905]|uniref:lytic transglycosylase domain-containing protein n=1 Tax=Streptomyces sp. WMMC905 TaxID=3404123 RepID=UPI003B9400C7